ncbi:MAG: hypothetical protein O7D30_09775, partial [Rickettsia endosymbiont of Ixodes persulcatus]|nr:hypothetical protein [Rickettsia endosymbiont of Ixodes persulcatus]
NAVLPETITAKIAIEAAAGDYWYRFVGANGKIIGLNRYGASAPAKDVYRECGLTSEHIVAIIKEVIYSAANKAHHLQAPCISGAIV